MKKRVFLYGLIGGLLTFNAIFMAIGAMVPFPTNVDGAIYLSAAHAWPADPTLTPGYLYPPTLAWLLQHVPAFAWHVFIIGCTLALIPLLELPLPIAIASVVLFPPAFGSAWVGNVNAAIAVLYALALRRRAGAWLAMGALIKLTPGVGLAVLLVRRQWRQVGIAALICLLALPIAPLSYWINGTLHAATMADRSDFALSVSWLGVVPGPVGVAIAVALCVVLLVSAPFLDERSAFAAAAILPLLIARIVWTYHTVMILPALALIWNKGKLGRALAAFAWLAFALDRSKVAMPLSLTLCMLYLCLQPVERKARAGHERPRRSEQIDLRDSGGVAPSGHGLDSQDRSV